MAEGVTVANAFVQVMPSMQGIEGNITSALTDALVPAGEKAGDSGGQSIGAAIMSQLGALGSKVAGMGGEVGQSLAGGAEAVLSGAGKVALVAAAAGVALAVGKALLDVGGTFDEMTDAIIVGTGASGDALQELKNTAVDVATSVPTSFQNAGYLVQEFNTRMGLSGPVLDDVASKAASLQNLVGKVNFDQLTGAFNAFGLSGEQASQEMDYLFGVVQSTGIGFDQLTGIVKNAGPSMQALGFSFNDVADMAGQLDKAGMNASGVMNSMNRAFANVAKDGGDVQQAFRDSVTEIQGFIRAGDDAAAVNAAGKIFGTRNAAQFVGALKSGAVNLDQLGKSALGAAGDIRGTEEATADFPEKLQVLGNKVKAAFAPLGEGLFSAVNAGVDGLSGAFDALGTAAGQAGEFIGPIVEAVGGALAPVVESVGGGVQMLSAAFSETLLPALATVQPVFVAVGNVLANSIAPILATVAGIVGTVFAGAFSVAASVVSGAMEVIGGVIQAVVSVVQTVVGAFVGVFTGDWQMMSDGAAGVMSGLGGILSGILNGVAGVVGGILQTIAGLFASAFNGVAGVVGGIFQGVADAITSPIDSASGLVRDGVNAIANAISGVHLELPHIALPHFHVSGGEPPWGIGGQGSMPSFGVDWYARGGIVTRAAVLGESGAEAIVPYTNSNIRPWAAALADAMGEAPGGDDAVVEWLARNLGPIIAAYAPQMGERDFARAVQRAVVTSA